MSVHLFLVRLADDAMAFHDEPTGWVIADRDEAAALAACSADVTYWRRRNSGRGRSVEPGPFKVSRVGTAARGVKAGTTILTQTLDG